MINLDKLKIVLYDYDHTLCIHTYHNASDDTTHEYNINVILNGKEAWSTCKPNKHMKEFMELCKSKGIRQGLISATHSNKHGNSKNEWVLDRYGIELENFCVSTSEDKIEMMKAIADAYNYERYEILIVDDYYATLELAANNNFQACSPMEIVNFIEEKRKKGLDTLVEI